MVSFSIGANGLLTKINSQTTVNGMLHAAVTKNGAFLTGASYSGRSVQTFPLSTSGNIGSILQTFTFNTSPGPVSNRQDNSHPHQVIFDPTEKFLISNDLGSDLIRIYSVSGTTLTAYTNIAVPGGQGPRHGQFVQLSSGLFYYLVNEMGNSIAVYSVTYPSNGISLTEVQRVSSYGTATVPAKNPQPTAGEIQISPDKKFAYVSNRGDVSFSSPSSDSISAWSINSDGTLSFLQLLRAGGSTPRHFSLDPSGQYVSVALQNSNLVAFFQRDANSGLWPNSPVASVTVATSPVCVQWLPSSTSTSTTTTSTTTRSTTTSTTTTRSTTTTTRSTSILITRSTTSSTTTTSTTTTAQPTTTTQGGSPLWGQCGGIGYTGPTSCSQGTCKVINPYYSQCLN